MNGLLFYVEHIVEVLSAAVLAYAIAVSTDDSKKIIKQVLIGTGVYAVTSLLLGGIGIRIGIVLPFVVFPVVFGGIGGRTEHKFNIAGLFSLIAYIISLFTLPVIANKYEDSLVYSVAGGITDMFDRNLTPTQFEILKNASSLSEYSDTIENYLSVMTILFIGVILFAILLFDMILLRRNSAQMVMGGILSVLTSGMLYLDYLIFHFDSLGGKLVGMALSKMGFSLSRLCILIILFAVLTVVSAYRCDKKERT